MKIEILVYIYLYISVCVILFDCLFTVSTAVTERLLPKRIEQLKIWIHWQMVEIREFDRPSPSLSRKIEKKLGHISYLRAFVSAIEMEDEELHNDFKTRFLPESGETLRRLAIHYRNKPPESRAFYAYMIAQLQLGNDLPGYQPNQREEVEHLASILVRYGNDDSVYVRENSFKALLSIGCERYVLEAVQQINSTPAYQNEKLLSDDLLEFVGDQRKLLDGLWSSIGEFVPMMQVSIINYMRLLRVKEAEPQRFNQDLYAMLAAPKTNLEVKLAVIRFFRKYPYQPAYQMLLSLLDADGDEWELAAVSATTLQAYPGSETMAVLSRAITNANWYVRFNAADSLIQMGVDSTTIGVSSGRGDAFAREMMEYRREVHHLQKRDKSGKKMKAPA